MIQRPARTAEASGQSCARGFIQLYFQVAAERAWLDGIIIQTPTTVGQNEDLRVFQGLVDRNLWSRNPALA